MSIVYKGKDWYTRKMNNRLRKWLKWEVCTFRTRKFVLVVRNAGMRKVWLVYEEV